LELADQINVHFMAAARGGLSYIVRGHWSSPCLELVIRKAADERPGAALCPVAFRGDVANMLDGLIIPIL